MIQSFNALRGHPLNATTRGSHGLDLAHVRSGHYSNLFESRTMEGFEDPWDQSVYDAAVLLVRAREKQVQIPNAPALPPPRPR